MNVSIRLTGPLAKAIGTSRLGMNLEERATVADLIDLLAARYPDLASRLSRVVVAAGGRVVSHEEPLNDGDEIAFLIPVAGGCPETTMF